MAQVQTGLAQVCTPENKIRETYYGDTHRAQITIKNVCRDKQCDILHISIPFAPDKEAKFMQRFDVRREDLPAFYRSFTRAVLNHERLSRELRKIVSQTIEKAIISYLSVQSVPKLDKEGKQYGVDLFMVSEPMDPFVGSETFTQEGASLKSIVSLGIRMLQTAKAFNDHGFTMGAIDLDSCYLATDDKGNRLLKNGYLFYGTGAGIKPAQYTEDVRNQILYEELSEGYTEQSIDTDVYMLCGLLWTMLDGKHYTSGLQPEKIPKYAPPELAEVLQMGLKDRSNAFKAVNVGLRTFLKWLNEGRVEDTYIPFEPPVYYLNPLPEPRVDEVTDSVTETSEGTETKKSGNRIATAVLAVIAAASMLGVGAWFTILNEHGILHERFFPTPTEAPIVTPAPTPTPRLPESSEEGLYSGKNGMVLNADGQANEAYIMDSGGNIVTNDEEHSLVYRKAQVTPYIFLEKCSIGIKDRKYTDQGAFGKDAVLREGIIDLRYTTYFNSIEEPFELNETLISQYELKEGDYIMVNDIDPAYEDPVGFTVFVVNIFKTEEGNKYAVSKLMPTDRDLYRYQGTWRYTCRIQADPKQPTNSKILVASEDPANLKLVVDRNGQETKAKAVRLALDSSGTAEIVLEANVEGKYYLTITSDDQTYTKRFAVTFEPTEDSVIPTPVPTSAPKPVTTPSPTPTPTPVPQQQYYSSGGSGYYSQPSYSGGSSSYYTQPTPVPNTNTGYPDVPDTGGSGWTPEFTVDQTEYTIHVGETIQISPSLGCTISSTPPGIVTYPSNVVPFEITGAAPGTCTLVLNCTYSELQGQQIIITIHVIN